MNAHSFLISTVRPTLRRLLLGGLAAEQLLIGTALQESLLLFRRQIGGGPALGLFQMEPATHDDIWDNFLAFRPALTARLRTLSPARSAAALETDDVYATALARFHYLRVAARLPSANDIEAQAHYWKTYYNTEKGAGDPAEYLDKWSQCIDPMIWGEE